MQVEAGVLSADAQLDPAPSLQCHRGHRILLAVNFTAGGPGLSNLGPVCPSFSGRWLMAMPRSLEEQGELSRCLCREMLQEGVVPSSLESVTGLRDLPVPGVTIPVPSQAWPCLVTLRAQCVFLSRLSASKPRIDK